MTELVEKTRTIDGRINVSYQSEKVDERVDLPDTGDSLEHK
jgi:hypothetical protein